VLMEYCGGVCGLPEAWGKVCPQRAAAYSGMDWSEPPKTVLPQVRELSRIGRRELPKTSMRSGKRMMVEYAYGWFKCET